MAKKSAFQSAFDRYLTAAEDIQQALVADLSAFGIKLRDEGHDAFSGRIIPDLSDDVQYMIKKVEKSSGDTAKRAEIRCTTIVKWLKNLGKLEVSNTGVVRYKKDHTYDTEWLNTMKDEPWDAKLTPLWKVPNVSLKSTAQALAKRKLANKEEPDWTAVLAELKQEYNNAIGSEAVEEWYREGISQGKIKVEQMAQAEHAAGGTAH